MNSILIGIVPLYVHVLSLAGLALIRLTVTDPACTHMHVVMYIHITIMICILIDIKDKIRSFPFP